MRSSGKLFLAAAAVVPLILAGCAASADDTSAGLEGEPIKIGQIAPTGTSVYNAQDSHAVAKAAVRGFNERGGLSGRPLELVYCNDENDPNIAAQCAREMVSEEVVAMVRSVVIAGGDQVSAILESAGIPDIGRSTLTPAELNAPSAYPLDGGVLSAYAGVMTKFVEQGGDSVFFAVLESENAHTTTEALKRMAEELGLEVAGTATVPPNTADYAPLVANIRESGAEGAVLAFTQQSLMQTIRTAEQAGLTISWLLNGGAFTEEDLASLPERQTDQFIVGTGTMPLSAGGSNEAVAEMRRDIEAQFESGDDDADPTKLFSNSFISWESVYVLDRLADGMETITAETITEKLNESENVDTGISVPWTPSRPGPTNFSRVSHPFVHISRIENGELVLVNQTPYDVGELMGS